jgi:hypothetical protein
MTGEIGIKGQNVNNIEAETVTLQQGGAGEIHAKTVTLSQAGANHIEADMVELRQAGAQQVKGQTITVRQGVVAQAKAETLTMSQGGVVLAEADQATLTTATVGVVWAKEQVVLDQSVARAILTGGEVSLDQSGTGVLLARRVSIGSNSNVLLMIAGRVDGQVNAVFGPLASAAFGAAFAVVLALLWRFVRR